MCGSFIPPIIDDIFSEEKVQDVHRFIVSGLNFLGTTFFDDADEKIGEKLSEIKDRLTKDNKEIEPNIKDSTKFSLENLINEILAGKWGKGEELSKELESAGYTEEEIKEVQTIVEENIEKNSELENETTKTQTTKVSSEQLANEIISGKWGNGKDRTEALKAAGYTEAEIKSAQTLVNNKIASNKNNSSTEAEKGNDISTEAEKGNEKINISTANKEKEELEEKSKKIQAQKENRQHLEDLNKKYSHIKAQIEANDSKIYIKEHDLEAMKFQLSYNGRREELEAERDELIEKNKELYKELGKLDTERTHLEATLKK